MNEPATGWQLLVATLLILTYLSGDTWEGWMWLSIAAVILALYGWYPNVKRGEDESR